MSASVDEFSHFPFILASNVWEEILRDEPKQLNLTAVSQTFDHLYNFNSQLDKAVVHNL